MYNFKFFPQLVLLIIFVWSTFSGIIILKTGIFQSPFKRKKYYEGLTARIAGLLLISLGLSAIAAPLYFVYFWDNKKEMEREDFQVGHLAIGTPVDSLYHYYGHPKDSSSFSTEQIENPFLGDSTGFENLQNNFDLLFYDSLTVLTNNHHILNFEFTSRKFLTYRGIRIGMGDYEVSVKYGTPHSEIYDFGAEKYINYYYLNNDKNVKIIIQYLDFDVHKISMGRF